MLHAVLAKVVDEPARVEDAVAAAIEADGECLRRAAYNGRVREGVLARFHERVGSKRRRTLSSGGFD